jgi:transposase
VEYLYQSEKGFRFYLFTYFYFVYLSFMKIQLTDEQVNQLKVLHKTQTVKRYADRIKVILLLNSGYSRAEVSDILLIDEDTVSKWKFCFLNRASSEDLSSWFSDNYVGYVGKLSYTSLSYLRTYLKDFNVSTKARIQSYLVKSEGVEYSLSGIQKLFKRIGISHNTIKRIPGKANIETQAVFIDKLMESISNLSDNETIMFMDSVHPQHNTVCSKVWIEKGSQRWIESNTGRQRVNINGVYNPFNQKIVTQQDSTINAGVTIKLLQKVSEQNPQFEKIYIVADNAKYNKCKDVQAFLATQNKIQMVYLPPYSPNLNLIERVWKFMHEKVIHLTYFDTFSKFKKSINAFFDDFEQYKDELKSRITFNFQTFENATFATA